jgi:polyisoprenoid-binding protein YceI
MRLKFALVPLLAAVALAGYVGLHPGHAYSAPRMAAASATALGQAAYSIDPNHSSISFEITHMGLANIHGRINKFSGKIIEDESDLTKSSVEFTAQVETVDTAIPARDNHLRAADFFEVAKYPELSFKSTKVAKKRNGYVVTGDLTMAT